MTLEEYQRILIDWTRDVQAEAIRLFETGADPTECTGLAINIVESRRRKTAKALQRLAPVPMRGH